jgi:integrase
MSRGERHELDTRTISSLRPRERAYELADARIRGLRIVVEPSGRLTWSLRYTRGGRQTRMALGAYPAFGLVSARSLAATALLKIASGIDPASERKRRHAPTVSEVFAQYEKRHIQAKLRPSTGKEIGRLFVRRILPAIGDRPIAEVERRELLRILDVMVADGAGVSANRALAAMSHFFRFAVRSEFIATSPAMNVEKPTPQRPRERVLSDEELAVLWKAADQIGIAGRIVKLLVLTGQRLGEVRGMTWDEVDLAERVWRLSGLRTKNKREHFVPLSELAVEVINTMPRTARFVFCARRTEPVVVAGRVKERLDALIANDSTVSPWTFHDLRRTAATGLARLGTRQEVVEKVLNHASGLMGGIGAVYNRFAFMDERRAALDLWADHVQKLAASADREPRS